MIIGLLDDPRMCTIRAIGIDFGSGIERSAKAAVMGGQPEFLGVIRPAVGNVVLAAAVDLEGAEGKHRAAVLDGRALIVSIKLNLIRARQIVQRLPVGGE